MLDITFELKTISFDQRDDDIFIKNKEDSEEPAAPATDGVGHSLLLNREDLVAKF